MNISIIVPNYNGEKLLEKNLPTIREAVKNYKDGFVEIIITDDASSDDSKRIVEEFFATIHEKHIRCKYIQNIEKAKRGFSKNVNRGVKSSEGEIVILLNSDVSPSKDFLSPLLARFSDPSIFAVGCLDQSIENDKVVLRGRGIGRWQRGFLMHGAGKIGDKNTTLWVSGGSSAFRKSIWEKLSGFDPIYDPFYWEDIDLSYRALKAGYTILFEQKSIVRHEHEKGAIKTAFSPSVIKGIAYRNQFIFIWKNISETNLWISHLVWLPYHLLKALFRGDTAFFKGLSLAVHKLPKILISRRQARRYFIRKDSIIIKEYSQ